MTLWAAIRNGFPQALDFGRLHSNLSVFHTLTHARTTSILSAQFVFVPGSNPKPVFVTEEWKGKAEDVNSIYLCLGLGSNWLKQTPLGSHLSTSTFPYHLSAAITGLGRAIQIEPIELK